jgi:23S rRNA U2552 (ribose-2'-O)-methylase RlmE/FtsJ
VPAQHAPGSHSHAPRRAGDIRKKAVIESLWEECKGMYEAKGVPGAVLVTADGGIDTQEHPNEQEALTASLHYAELVTAFGLLAKGGSVFLKAFTIFEHSTLAMLYLIGAFFDRVRSRLVCTCDKLQCVATPAVLTASHALTTAR